MHDRPVPPFPPVHASRGRRPSVGGSRRIGVLLTVALALAVLAGVAVVVPRLSGGAPDRSLGSAGLREDASGRPLTGPHCTLVVPASPLSPTGLATPYQLRSTSGDAGACHETNPASSAFVEAVVFDPARHQFAVYHPLVVDEGSRPAVEPVAVSLPDRDVVGLWFGFNGGALTLAGPGSGHCVDGVAGSPFGRFAYCNAREFFAAVHADPQAAVPPLGTGRDGLPCPTDRDFAVVDQTQSDELATSYRVVDGLVAQDTRHTRSGQELAPLSGGSTLADAVDPALGCTPFQAPDLTDGGTPTSALALDELSAAAHQARPSALVPGADRMVRVGDGFSLRKANLYRAGVDQPAFPAGQSFEGYCQHVREVSAVRFQRSGDLLRAAGAPIGWTGDLLGFLQQRVRTTLQDLSCPGAPSSSDGAAPPADGATSPSPAPSPAPAPAPSPAPAPAPSPAPVSPGGIAWGTSVMAYGGENSAQALARVEQQLAPQVIRFFDPGAPSWPRSTGSVPLVISFKIPPSQVLDGSHDAQLAAFFAATPRPTYWSYWHEPEDDIARGSFTAAQYRTAWVHIASIARASGKPLTSTLILMGWSTQPASGRHWTDYYPGPDVIDVLAWDCYVHTSGEDPANVYGSAQKASVQAGKPWAVAETGVATTRTPIASERQAELTALSRWLATTTPRPRFVTYFDSDPTNQGYFGWNISKDPAAAAAWRAGQAGQAG